MIDPGQVTAVVPTRGNHPEAIELIVGDFEEAGFGEIIIAGPELYGDRGVYKRYLGIADAKFPVVFTHDDDVRFHHVPELLGYYKPGRLTIAYTQPWDTPWVSCGAVFDRDLPALAFERYFAHYPCDEFFTHKGCDAVFGLLTEDVIVFQHMPYEELAHAHEEGRCSSSEGWYERDRPLIRNRCFEIRG